jgi:hypothetical protein
MSDEAAVKRAQLRDLLDEHAVARVDFERARLRLDDAWAAVQRFLAGVS